MRRLQYHEFCRLNDKATYTSEMNILQKLKSSVGNGNVGDSQKYLEEFKNHSYKLIKDLNNFTTVQSEGNYNFRFWSHFIYRHEIVMDLIRADWEGIWELHLDAMQHAMSEFAAWDSTNYLRWATLYL